MKTPSSKDDLLLENKLDYSKTRPNRFAGVGSHTIVLDEGLSKVFKTLESVNKVLRAGLEAMPPGSIASR